MSNKQNDEIYDNITDIPGLAELIGVVEKISGECLSFYQTAELSHWLLAHDLEMLEFSKRVALKAISDLTKGLM